MYGTDADTLYDALRSISQFMAIHSRSLHKTIGLTAPQLSVLLVLAKESPLLVTEISKRVHLSIGTISGTIFRLEEKGFIERMQSTDDRRKALLSLTPKGQDILQSTPSPFPETFINNFEHGIAAWEREMILTSLLKLTYLMGCNGNKP